MEMLILVPKMTNRLFYIFELLFKEELGIDFKFTLEEERYLAYHQIAEYTNYGYKEIGI